MRQFRATSLLIKLWGSRHLKRGVNVVESQEDCQRKSVDLDGNVEARCAQRE